MRTFVSSFVLVGFAMFSLAGCVVEKSEEPQLPPGLEPNEPGLVTIFDPGPPCSKGDPMAVFTTAQNGAIKWQTAEPVCVDIGGPMSEPVEGYCLNWCDDTNAEMFAFCDRNGSTVFTDSCTCICLVP